MNKYATPDNCYNDWQTPPGKPKKVHVACHLALIEDFKTGHDNLINISRKKALTKHENVVVKAFFCAERCASQNFTHLASDKQGARLTCPQSKERFNAGFKVEKSVNQDESALSRDRVSGVYIYGVRRKGA